MSCCSPFNIEIKRSYNELANRPRINDIVLEGNKTLADLGYVGDNNAMVSTTYAKLKALRDSGNLGPGIQYRITDYVATTNGARNSISANHPFDIIVTANSAASISEVARAIQHEGDEYFANSNLAAWTVWYSLDNDSSRFDWADEENGRGVIFRLVDEYDNDVSFDFKGFVFSFEDKTYYMFNGGDGVDASVAQGSAYRIRNNTFRNTSPLSISHYFVIGGFIFVYGCENTRLIGYFVNNVANGYVASFEAMVFKMHNCRFRAISSVSFMDSVEDLIADGMIRNTIFIESVNRVTFSSGAAGCIFMEASSRTYDSFIHNTIVGATIME